MTKMTVQEALTELSTHAADVNTVVKTLTEAIKVQKTTIDLLSHRINQLEKANLETKKSRWF